MNTNCKRSFVTASVCMALMNHLQAAPVVGQIEDLNCVSEAYTLTRNGMTIPVEIFTLLQQGDQIALNGEKHTISLKLKYEQTIDVSHQTPQTVVAPPIPVKMISMGCRIEAYTVKRHGKTLPIPTTLLIGDQIVVDKTKHTIQLKLWDSQLVEVNSENSPYTVPSINDEVATTSGNLWTWVRQVVTDWHEEDIKTTTGSAHTRGSGDSGPEIPAPFTNLRIASACEK